MVAIHQILIDAPAGTVVSIKVEEDVLEVMVRQLSLSASKRIPLVKVSQSQSDPVPEMVEWCLKELKRLIRKLGKFGRREIIEENGTTRDRDDLLRTDGF